MGGFTAVAAPDAIVQYLDDRIIPQRVGALVPSTTTLLRSPDGEWSSDGGPGATFVGNRA